MMVACKNCGKVFKKSKRSKETVFFCSDSCEQKYGG